MTKNDSKSPALRWAFFLLLRFAHFLNLIVMNALSFKIHADLDGYLDDPAMGQVNEMIYDTILSFDRHDVATNRPYPIPRPPEVIFTEAYSLMNDFANELHPEEDFIRKHFYKVCNRLIDTYAAEIVLSVDFVLLRLQDERKNRFLISSIKRAVDANSAYFKAFERLADELSGPVVDWKAKYNALQRQYDALSASIPQPLVDKKNQLRIPFDTYDAASKGFVHLYDLLAAADKIKTDNVYKVLTYAFADITGDFQELVKVTEKVRNDEIASTYISHLAISNDLSEIDLIRVFLSLYEAGFIINRKTGKKPTQKEYFNTIGELFNIDLSDAVGIYSRAIQQGCSEVTTKAIFNALAQKLVNKPVGKNKKKNRT